MNIDSMGFKQEEMQNDFNEVLKKAVREKLYDWEFSYPLSSTVQVDGNISEDINVSIHVNFHGEL